jgi:hypothetical protein
MPDFMSLLVHHIRGCHTFSEVGEWVLGEWRMEKEVTRDERQEACGETFSENSPFFTHGGEEVRFSILREWALRHSRRGCHVTILRPPRMGGQRCDNPY